MELKMTMKHLFSALLLTAIMLGRADNVNANERQYYETRICEDCDYNYALTKAAEIKPAINCTGGDDPFNSDTAQAQQCFATPIKILVVDANSRNIWHFENTYTNQGQPYYNLANKVNHYSLIPTDAIQIVNQLLDIYEEMDAMAVEYTNRLNAGEFDYVINEANTSYMVRSSQTGTDPCEAYEYSDALRAAFDLDLKNTLQVSLQEKIWSESSILGRLFSSLSEIKFSNLNFNIGNTSTAIGGTWEINREAKQYKLVFSSGSLNRRTQVGFITAVDRGVIRLELHDDITYFDGKSLRDLKAVTVSSAQINECLAKALDAAYPKVVAGSGSSTPAMGNVALISGGGGHSLPSGSGGGTTTCKHTYYMNGVEIMSFEGTCP